MRGEVKLSMVVSEPILNIALFYAVVKCQTEGPGKGSGKTVFRTSIIDQLS